jgi:hypothetical protein
LHSFRAASGELSESIGWVLGFIFLFHFPKVSTALRVSSSTTFSPKLSESASLENCFAGFNSAAKWALGWKGGCDAWNMATSFADLI